MISTSEGSSGSRHAKQTNRGCLGFPQVRVADANCQLAQLAIVSVGPRAERRESQLQFTEAMGAGKTHLG